MSAESLMLFVLAGLLLNLAPGPDVLFVVSQGLRHGKRAAWVAACGITAGCSVHVAAAALGLSALLAASTLAFTVLKWVGAAYLVYVGVQMWRAPAFVLPALQSLEVQPPWRAQRVFWRAFATNALNPKVAVFFLAFLPQFIDPASTDKVWAFVGLGLIFSLNGLWVNAAWGLLAAWLSSRLVVVQRSVRVVERAAGGLFIVLGLKLALSENPVH